MNGFPVLSHCDATADTANAATHCGGDTRCGDFYDNATRIKVSTRDERHLHPLHGVAGGVGLVDEFGVLHVFGQPLEETQRLVEDYGHGDLRQLLEEDGSREQHGSVHYQRRPFLLSAD